MHLQHSLSSSAPARSSLETGASLELAAARAEHEVTDVVRVLCELLIHFEKHQAMHLRLSV